MARPWFEREAFFFRKRELAGIGALAIAPISLLIVDHVFWELSGWKAWVLFGLLMAVFFYAWDTLLRFMERHGLIRIK